MLNSAKDFLKKTRNKFFDSYYQIVYDYLEEQNHDESDADKQLRKQMKKIYAQQAEKLVKQFRKYDFDEEHLETLLEKLKVPENQLHLMFSYLKKAKAVGLEQFNKDTVVKAFRAKIPLDILYKLAMLYNQLNIDHENSFANFSKLFDYDMAPEDLLNLVNVLFEAKARNFIIRQDDLVKFYYANPEISHDLKTLFQSMLISQENNLGLTFDDFFKGVISGRSPKIFVQTWQKIKDNNLPISKSFYLSLNLDAKTIYKIVNLMATAKKYGQYIEFDKVYKQLTSGLKPDLILKVLIKMLDSGFEIDYDYISKLAANKVDLATIEPAFKHIRSNGIEISEFIDDLNRFWLLRKNAEENFNLFNFARSVVSAKNVFGIDKEIILNDYIAGVNVWAIIDTIMYARKQGVEISYPLAKALNRTEEGLKTIVAKALNPFEIDVDGVRVTTKDNIEILANINVFVLYNVANYFKGSGEDILKRRVKAIFIDEVQKKYNHDEIIENIELLSRNVLLRLLGKKPVQSPLEKVKLEEAGREIEEEKIEDRFSSVSKFIPVRILIPRIEFVKETFKDFEKIKHEYELHHKMAEAELEKLRAEIKIKEAWAESKDLRFLILKDEPWDEDDHHSAHNDQEEHH